MHPGWTLRLTSLLCKEKITLCHVQYTYRQRASLCVAPRANSAVIPLSSRLASPAPHHSRCSGGSIQGPLVHDVRHDQLLRHPGRGADEHPGRTLPRHGRTPRRPRGLQRHRGGRSRLHLQPGARPGAAGCGGAGPFGPETRRPRGHPVGEQGRVGAGGLVVPVCGRGRRAHLQHPAGLPGRVHPGGLGGGAGLRVRRGAAREGP